MMEAAVVLDNRGQAIFWHLPPGRSSVYLPDTRDLWDVLWSNRETLAGVAHSHPGSGLPGPSDTDLTTFAAIEEGLGRRLLWWITSRDCLIELRWKGPGRFDYVGCEVSGTGGIERWLHNLRDVSYDAYSTEQRPYGLDWIVERLDDPALDPVHLDRE